MVLGALVLLVIVAVKKQRLPRDRATWRHLIVAALVSNAAPYLLFALGETRVNSGIAGALNATTSLWTLALVLTFRQQKNAGPPQMLGFALGFVGCLLIFSPWQADHLDPLGATYCLLAAICYAISYVYMSRYLTPRQITPIVLATGQLIAASVWTALALPFGTAPTPHVDTTAWTALAVLGILGTGLAYIINYALVRAEGPTGASTVTYLVPAASVTLGILALSEPLSPNLITGTLIVLLGVALTRRNPATTKGPRPANYPEKARCDNSSGQTFSTWSRRRLPTPLIRPDVLPCRQARAHDYRRSLRAGRTR